MMVCESCGAERERVLRHREYGVATTHRVTRWLCRDCHPTIPTRRASAPTEDEGMTTEPAVTDGGTATACPRCTAATVAVHGFRSCPECHWHGR
jgi:transposase-like protein